VGVRWEGGRGTGGREVRGMGKEKRETLPRPCILCPVSSSRRQQPLRHATTPRPNASPPRHDCCHHTASRRSAVARRMPPGPAASRRRVGLTYCRRHVGEAVHPDQRVRGGTPPTAKAVTPPRPTHACVPASTRARSTRCTGRRRRPLTHNHTRARATHPARHAPARGIDRWLDHAGGEAGAGDAGDGRVGGAGVQVKVPQGRISARMPSLRPSRSTWIFTGSCAAGPCAVTAVEGTWLAEVIEGWAGEAGGMSRGEGKWDRKSSGRGRGGRGRTRRVTRPSVKDTPRSLSRLIRACGAA
jgi:hypothetical protein